ncbi:MAG: NAD-dependent epimerase/dehydratase family protein [Deltaproteobacteria bacterium]|nr:NAD-dependent epimerase/dehydratase family protein [Deltaproteobacteria bacterium]MBI3387496.1 NAD-dependent epimerase/dehydratase family protein [Deltaproteobacteria bacterium]
MKILITGGGGFVGSHLSEAFLARGDDVSILDTGTVAKVRHLMGKPGFHYIRDSIFNVEILEGLIARADLVYHLAAVVGVEYYVGDPYEVLNVNVNGTQNVLKLAFKHGKKVVFGSTSEVYGRNPKVPWREDDDRLLGSTRIDRWCYSTSKAVGEHFCFAYHKMGLPVTITRYFNVYGPRLDRLDVGRIITIFMGQVLRNEPLTVIGDGKQTRCFTYVDDAVQATIAAGTAPNTEGDVFNIGTAVETTILELAETMIAIGRSSSTIKFVTQESVYGTSYEDIPRRVPDNTKMHEVLGVKAETTLADGLRKTIEWFRTTQT